MSKLVDTTVRVERLVVDPNNFRFQDSRNYVPANESRFQEDSVQKRALDRLSKEGISELKSSITTNGFLPFERIIVRPYSETGGVTLYLVVEGNRRTAALKQIRQDHEAGVDFSQELLDVLDAVPVTVAEPENGEQDETLLLSLMGVRHVGGIKEWGGYQRAKLVTELKDRHSLETAEIASRLGMTAHEVNRRYRAFSALRQMMDDEEYGDQAVPGMYALFHEAVGGTVIKEWLGWDDMSSSFRDVDGLHAFYSLISQREDQDGGVLPPKLDNREAVRDLREILVSDDARRALLDPDQSFADSLAIAKAENLSRTWLTQIGEAIAALNKVGALELQAMSPEDLGTIERLRDTAQQLVDMSEKLRAS